MAENRGILNNLIAALIICVTAQLIGALDIKIGEFNIKILPIIWAILMATLLSPYLLGKYIPVITKIISIKEIKQASYLLSLTLYPLGVLFGIYAGPRIGVVLEAGSALLLQEIGNVFTMVIALPLGLMLGLGRSALGGTFSLCRDTALGIISDKYGLNSKEGTGTLGVYVFGSIFGTLIFAILAPIGLKLGFHPYALAMASGMGSGSMMGAATASLVDASPEIYKNDILVYSATSGLITAVFGVYVEMFVALPLANWYYNKVKPFCHKIRAIFGKEAEI